MCHSIPTAILLQQRALQQGIPNGCAAKNLPPSQRQILALQALAGTQSITDLADEFDVSRKFIYRQNAIAEHALVNAFTQRHPTFPRRHVQSPFVTQERPNLNQAGKLQTRDP